MSLPMVLIMLACTLLMVVYVNGHYSDPRLRAFNIGVEDTGTRDVTLTDNGQDATCSFSYQTSSVVVDASKPAAVTKKIELSDVLRELDSTCVSRSIDYWTFEICFGGQIKQQHGGDTYILSRSGTYDREAKAQLYDGGDACEALPNKDPRKVKVSFSCDKHATVPTIVTLTEAKTCSYAMIVATSRVCGDPSYPITSSTSDEQVDNSNEDWLLELVHLDDGRLMCSAYTTEHRATGSRLSFREFKLTLVPHESAVSDNSQYVARRPGRIPVEKGEVVFSNNQLTHGKSFGGKLSFLKIIT